MRRTWILQANPKLYDVDGALQAGGTIYWRIPQYAAEVSPGDAALIWRSGKDAGFVGWGVFQADPGLYDLSKVVDPFSKSPAFEQAGEIYAPIVVWRAAVVPKAAVAQVLPSHRIVVAPMGTVFPLATEDVLALDQLLGPAGYDLGRDPPVGFQAQPLLENQLPNKPPMVEQRVRAKITPAMFLMSSSPTFPTEITVEGDSLKLLLVEREVVAALEEAWDAVGVYLLIGTSLRTDASLSVYVGKAQNLRSRVKTGHGDKTWSRCLLVQRLGPHPFNASDISWLERRLIDVLLEAPAVELINKTPPPPELVPEYKEEILQRTVVAVLGVLGVLGAYVA
ncbi:MAG: hypothetical protein ACYCSF_12725 [Acidimicrobiales bacterium]